MEEYIFMNKMFCFNFLILNSFPVKITEKYGKLLLQNARFLNNAVKPVFSTALKDHKNQQQQKNILF